MGIQTKCRTNCPVDPADPEGLADPDCPADPDYPADPAHLVRLVYRADLTHPSHPVDPVAQ